MMITYHSPLDRTDGRRRQGAALPHAACFAGMVLAAFMALNVAQAAASNTVGYTESFEAYINGFQVSGTNGWGALNPVAGTVSTNAAVISGLVTYTNNGGAYPLPVASHSNVLQVTDEITNSIISATGGVVVVDFMVMPSLPEWWPTGSTDWHYAFCLTNNPATNLVVWHRYHGATTNNEWRTLTNGPSLTNGVWTRFTVVQDYASSMFQLRVNNGSWITDPAGWSRSGTGTPTPGGSWFYMVKTNSVMSNFRIGETATNYLDDVVLTNRQVAWSGTGFTEGVANNGTVTGTLTLGLLYDTFNGSSGDDFVASNKLQVANLPSNLTAVASYTSPTQLTVSLTGAALQHGELDSANLVFTFQDAAFTLGNAMDVYRSSSAVSLTFSNNPNAAPELRYDARSFSEVVANNGSVTGTTLRLSGKAFAGSNTEDFVASGKATVTNVPDGLVLQLTRDSAYQMTLDFAGHAANHTAGGTVSNLAVTFTDGAFDGGNAAGVSNAVVTNLVVQFHDQPALSWDATIFTEAAANDGSIATTNTVALTDPNSVATFVGGTYAAGTHFTTSGVPAGLSCVVWRDDATHVKVALAGQAAAHATNDNVSFTLQFQSAAFNTVAASNITGSTASLSITYSNQPSLSWDNMVFTEVVANDGSIATTNTVTLSGGATFTSGPYTPGNQFTTSGVPAGLNCVVWNQDATRVKVALSGSAAAHAAANSTNFTLQFNNAAFNTVAAANITGSATNLAVQFIDPATLTYSAVAFTEASQGTINNDSPITIILAHDTFTGAPGDNFVASNKVVVTHLPDGLTAAITRSSDTVLSVQLTGRALHNNAADSITNLTFQFQSTAFSNVAASGVVNALKPDLKINFVDDPFAYFVPYMEPFESYAGGAWLALVTNGWTVEYGGAGEVANTNTVGSWAHAYQGPVPVTATHTNELYVRSDIRSEIHSTPGQQVYLDFSVWPAPMVDAPQVSASMQLAFYVSTNGEFVIWHQNRTGGVTNNELRVLSNAPVIDTNRWLRVTVCQDYANSLFQVRLNNGAAITDAHGWTGPGGTANGSWFHMVQTNDYMSRFRVAGVGSGYIDDLTVRTNLVNQTPVELTLSPAEFSEAGDSGYIDNSNSNRISLAGAVGATFAGNDGDVYASGCVAASNLPPDLAVVLARTSPTNLAISLSGRAANNFARDNVTNLEVTVLDGAFAIGAANIAGAANVAGASQGGLRITFADTVGSVYLIR